MIVTLAEAKKWLKVEYDDEDDLITGLISTAETLVNDTMREVPNTASQLMKDAAKYCLAYLHEHREDADMNLLTKNIRCMLSTVRKAEF